MTNTGLLQSQATATETAGTAATVTPESCFKPPDNAIWNAQPGPQRQLIRCPVEDIFFGGARGGGKTDGMLGKWINHADRYGKHAKGIIIRRNMPELEEILYRSSELFSGLAKYNYGAKTWRFKSGARVKFRFLEHDKDADRYQGHSYTFIGLDELANWAKPDAVDKLRATLRSPHGIPCQMIGTGNPGGLGQKWVKERYIIPARLNNLRPFYDAQRCVWRTFIPSSLRDNPALLKNDPKYIDRLKASGPSWLVKAWLDGDWDASFEGSIFRREWWRYYKALPDVNDITYLLQSWDTAHEKGDEAAYSVCETWACCRQGYYLLDVWRDKIEFPTLLREVKAKYMKWRPALVLMEYKSSGVALAQVIERETNIPMKRVTPDKDKVARANATAPIIEGGRVFLPEEAAWLSDFLDETAACPEGQYWDIIDAMTQALRYMHGEGLWEAGRA